MHCPSDTANVKNIPDLENFLPTGSGNQTEDFSHPLKDISWPS